MAGADLNWDDLRIIAAVKDEGTFAGASARLRIDETTVARRLARIQRALGVRLFEAVDGLRRPTPECERILGHVRDMAVHVAKIGQIGDSRPGLTGRLRIACTNGVAEHILAPRIAPFLAQHPGLAIQLLLSSDNVQFSRWQADIAIRLRKPDRGDFTIAKLAEQRLFFIEPAAGSETPVICAYPPELDQIPETQFLKARGLHQEARCVTDNIRVIHTLLRSHRAVGVLPDYLCDDLRADRRLKASLLPKGREVWMLVQNHLKQDRATRAVIDWVRDCFQQLRP
ncbi:MAG: LysR family transcriptional regulator [Pseudomonadota bacterium]